MIEVEIKMMIRKLSCEDLSICVNIAEIAYMKEAKLLEVLQVLSIKNELTEKLSPFFNEERGYILEQDGIILGYMVEGYIWLDGDVKHIHIPVFGCGIVERNDRQTILQKLFQRHAADMAKDGLKFSYEIKLYEYDKELITALVYEQFGFISLEGLKEVNEQKFEPTEGEYYVMLPKEVILKEKETILRMYHSLVKHLEESPVFYPGDEFTDDVYMEYILEEGTNLYVVYKENRIIGLIDASQNESFIFGNFRTYDFNHVFVDSQYRGSGIASRLLQFAENDLAQRGIKKIHVEHGTANITARLFWDKHFTTVIYSLIRDINPIA